MYLAQTGALDTDTVCIGDSIFALRRAGDSVAEILSGGSGIAGRGVHAKCRSSELLRARDD